VLFRSPGFNKDLKEARSRAGEMELDLRKATSRIEALEARLKELESRDARHEEELDGWHDRYSRAREQLDHHFDDPVTIRKQVAMVVVVGRGDQLRKGLVEQPCGLALGDALGLLRHCCSGARRSVD
jgi:predicted nuclease with TOPRIM domain